MKEIEELVLPDDIRYAKDHEWAQPVGDRFRVGISDYAQSQLGDIVFVELPKPGDVFEQGEAFGTVESVKAVSELYMPVGGEILSINSTLETSPELVNEDPYHQGWMIDIQPKDPAEFDTLMNKDVYLDMLKGLEK